MNHEMMYWAPQRKPFGGWVCFKSDPEPPKAPDPQVTAAAQTKMNIDTANAQANLNRVNQVTPWGSQTYTQGAQNPDGTSQWTQTTSLDPAQQALLDSSNRISQGMADTGEGQLGRVNDALAKPLNYDDKAPWQVTRVLGGKMQNGVEQGGIQNQVDMSKVPDLIGGEALNTDLQTQRDSLYNQQKAFLDPQWKQDQSDLENKLTQQGIMQNSDAWNRATGDFSRNKEFAYNNARMGSITGGGAEQSRLFGVGLASNQNAYGQALSNGQFANQAQAQRFGQDMQNAQMANSNQNQLFNQDLTNANLQNAGRASSINEQNYLRQQPLNELNALRTGSQVTAPQFGATPQSNVSPTDIMGQYNNQFQAGLASYNGQVASGNSNTQGIVGLAAAAAAAY